MMSASVSCKPNTVAHNAPIFSGREEIELERPCDTLDARATRKETAEEVEQSDFDGNGLRLHELPNELLSHVFSFLEIECPSEANWNRRPSNTLTRGKTRDLKNISETAKQFRRLVLSRLFAHVRLDPYQSTAFIAFIAQNDLTTHVKTLVACLPGPCTHIHPLWWARLLSTIPIPSFTILCPPYVFAELASTSIVDMDSWTFNMPFQIIRFRQTPSSHSARASSLDKLSHSLLIDYPWTSFSINEGSSLKAYSQYEYFLRRTPSLMSALNLTRSTDADAMFVNLSHFAYTAIFPFYNHVDEVLKSVRKMKNLKSFATKLCPEPDSNVVEDELADALGHIDINDAWMEFDTAYTLVAHTVIFLTVEGVLEEFHVDDVKMEGIRENLEQVVSARLQEWWVYGGNGLWKRKD